MSAAGNKLPPDRLKEALAVVRDWQQNPNAVAHCPVCGAPGLVIEDRSTRPHAEWYALSCASCGLEDTIHIPLGPPPGSFG